MRSPNKETHIGALVGVFLGSGIELLVLLRYLGLSALLDRFASGGMVAAIWGAFFGGILIGISVGLLVGGIGLSAAPREFQVRKVPRIAIAAGVMGAIFGALNWGLGGLPLTLGAIRFGILGGIFIGWASGAVAGGMVGRVNQARTAMKEDFHRRWGNPLPSYEEHLKQTGQYQKLREHRKRKKM